MKTKTDFYQAKELDIEINTDNRWESGEDHHPMSHRIAEFIENVDTENGYVFDWKFGGDGDNGEELMYQLDVFFDFLDKLNEHNC